jgi:hypothetical protein
VHASNPLAAQPAVRHRLGDVPAGARQPPGDLQHPPVLDLVAVLPPDRVVQVLAAAGGVRADRLQVAALVAADPDVAPGRRDRQVPQALQRRRVRTTSSPSRYSNPRPRRRRVMPGPEHEDRRSRTAPIAVLP